MPFKLVSPIFFDFAAPLNLYVGEACAVDSLRSYIRQGLLCLRLNTRCQQALASTNSNEEVREVQVAALDLAHQIQIDIIRASRQFDELKGQALE